VKRSIRAAHTEEDAADSVRIQMLQSIVDIRRRLALATDSARIGIWEWDVVTNRLVWDKRMYLLYGIPEQEFSGAYGAWRDGVHPQDQPRCDSEIAAALAGEKDFHTEFRVVWPNGELRDIEAHGIVERAADDSPLVMIGAAIAELRRDTGLFDQQAAIERGVFGKIPGRLPCSADTAR
jgi:PAS domain-containing protein